MPIHIMSAELASQIAAGEVVERPASVVKELVENAIDAGATDIRIETREGGRRLVRVSDNGDGISADEIELAFSRHATSKLSTVDELSRIQTLGFRGEALASIASVAQVTCVSRARAEEVGARIRIDGGQVLERAKIGAPAGTVAAVENLFHSVPARLKFLKSDATERRHIDALVTRYALAYPSIRFHLTHDGRASFQTTGSGSMKDVLVAVYGADAAEQMLALTPDRPLPTTERQSSGEGVQVSGFVSAPALTRANRGDLTIFVNGRWVQDRGLSAAIVQAYHALLMVGRYPVCVVRVDLPPEDVDVNVHPAKTEVRFRDGDAVFRAVQRAVRRTLVDRAPIPAITARPKSPWQPVVDQHELGFTRTTVPPAIQPLSQSAPDQATTQPPDYPTTRPLDHSTTRPPDYSTTQPPDYSTTQPPDYSTTSRELPMLRVIGQIGGTYIIAEGPEGMYLLDQHAAHERILFEKFMADKAGQHIAVQNLLDPLPVEFTPQDASLVEENRETLAAIGLNLEPFGGNTWLVRSVPAIMASDDIRAAMADLVADLLAGDVPFASDEEEKLITRVCKRAAIKAGQALSHPEMQELVRQLEACRAPRTCPHGRPTMIHLSAEQLAKEFGRR
ncbi:MAG TPA: DNA mismatch repair endonuclease MutL [Anaerolineae bacterium]|nr:DNA mismatch repair endonuclease MutL [Anaerolineae bacterium]